MLWHIKRKLIHLLAAIAAVLALFSLGACGDDPAARTVGASDDTPVEIPDVTPDETTPGPVESEGPVTGVVGKPVKTDTSTYEVTVLSVREAGKVATCAPEEGVETPEPERAKAGRYIAVELKVTNVSYKPRAFAGELLVMDQDARSYEDAYLGYACYADGLDLITTNIQPMTSITGTFLFDVPPAVKKVTAVSVGIDEDNPYAMPVLIEVK